MTGLVKMYDSKKRYGYIAGDDGRDYFINKHNIHTQTGGLIKGYMVEFTPTMGNRGYEAENVKLF